MEPCNIVEILKFTICFAFSDPVENVKEILTYVIKQHAYSKAKKLGYLNVFVKLIDKCGGSANLGFPLRSILIW